MPTHPLHDEIDLLDGSWYATLPHDTYTWMRENAPAYYDAKTDTWAVTRYHDVVRIERDPKTFSSVRAPRPHGQSLPMMISMDDPQHHRRRALVARGFTPKRVRDHEANLLVMCDAIIDRIAEQGACDFVWDIAAPLPLLVIGEMLGFDPSDYDDLLRWSDDLIRGTSATSDAEAVAKAGQAGLEYHTFQRKIIADRRANGPRDDLISILCHAEIEGEKLDDDSIANEALLILIGGDETTRHVISRGMLALIERPDQQAILANDPSKIEVGVEELLRFVSPILNMARTVTAEVDVAGETMRPGDQVVLIYPSANRDEAVFADPQRLNVERQPNPHIAFGFGPHFCLGASLARLELKSMFTRLLDRLPDIQLVEGAELPYRNSNFITGPEAMPVTFTPRPRLTPA
ncbi:MAG: cytochrome [Ilumatobacteraceae bacterium]|nr:cytochrome [Ilumatobacteraceae bacterium]